MSDFERDLDMDSDDGDDFLMMDSEPGGSPQDGFVPQHLKADKRAHHNALERKRRDHIKDSFSSLRDSVPALKGESKASRAQILKKAADYIQFMRRKNSAHQQDIDNLKVQNSKLASQIESIAGPVQARATGNFAVAAASEAPDSMAGFGNGSNSGSIGGVHIKTESDFSYSRESESDSDSSSHPSKRQKTISLS